MQKLIATLLLWAAIISPLYAADTVKPQEIYSFAIGPQQSASELAKRWVPVMQYLSEKTGYSFQFTTAKDIPTFQKQMIAGEFDFAYINPYHYLAFHEKAGYEALAHERDGNLTGIVVVRKDSPIHNMSDLNNQTLAFAAPTALAATMLPLASFDEQKVNVTPKYVTSMDSVYLSVAKGFLPAGGGEMRSFKMLAPDVQNQLRILWTSEVLPPFPFTAHSRVPKEVVAKLQKVMQEMDKNPQGVELLKAINFKGIDSANDSSYNGMRKLKLKLKAPVQPPAASN